MSEELDLLRRRLERERAARKQAERIAEEKSRELFTKGQALQAALSAESEARRQVALLLAESERLAVTDSLTGAGNRRAFTESGTRLMGLALRHSRPLSVALFDIDFFKKVNDQHGHGAGDRVLVGLVQAFRSVMRVTDVLSRWGGEEFVVLLPETDEAGALVSANRLRASLSALAFEQDGRVFKVTASAGVAQSQGQGDSLDAMLKRADEALYQAKEAGRDRAVVWRPAAPTAASSASQGLAVEVARD